MGRNNYFQFKQFTINHQNSAMKVGTDGVLLGAWTRTEGINSILDIGTGSGLIALMLAQRSTAYITAIDLEPLACKDAMFNVENSPWKDRVAVIETSLQDYYKNPDQLFDCIVCNPPFFKHSVKPENIQRSIARHNDMLSFKELLEGVCKLLNPKGHFALIIPSISEREFKNLAANVRLFPKRITRVKPKPFVPYSRILMEFTFEAILESEDELTIETEKHHEYLPEFINLVKDFYLKL